MTRFILLYCDKCSEQIGQIENNRVVLFGFSETFEKWRRPLIECPRCKKISKPGTTDEIAKREAQKKAHKERL